MWGGGGGRQSNMVASVKARSNPERFRATFPLTLPLSWNICCNHAFKMAFFRLAPILGETGGGGGGDGGGGGPSVVASIKVKGDVPFNLASVLGISSVTLNLSRGRFFVCFLFCLAPIMRVRAVGGTWSPASRFKVTFLLTLPLSWNLCCSHGPLKGAVVFLEYMPSAIHGLQHQGSNPELLKEVLFCLVLSCLGDVPSVRHGLHHQVSNPERLGGGGGRGAFFCRVLSCLGDVPSVEHGRQHPGSMPERISGCSF